VEFLKEVAAYLLVPLALSAIYGWLRVLREQKRLPKWLSDALGPLLTPESEEWLISAAMRASLGSGGSTEKRDAVAEAVKRYAARRGVSLSASEANFLAEYAYQAARKNEATGQED
jgi:hypothetical protein